MVINLQFTYHLKVSNLQSRDKMLNHVMLSKLKIISLVTAVSILSIGSFAHSAPTDPSINTTQFDLPVDQSIHYMTRQTWTTRDGLPHNSINAIAQDKQGFLWFGTWQGPEVSNLQSRDKMLKHVMLSKLKIISLVTAVSILSIGSFAHSAPTDPSINTTQFDLPVDQSIHYMTRQTWTTRDGLPHNSINAIAQDKQGFLWFGTWQGPVRFNGKDFEIYDDIRITGLPDIGIFSIALNPCDDSIYVAGARGGLSRFHDNRWLSLEPAPPFVNEVEIDAHCTIWVSSSEQGLLTYENNERVSQFTTENGLPSNNVYQARIDDKSNLWAATSAGLAVKPAGSTRFKVIEGIPADRIRKLFLDTDGQLLIGTGNGVYQQQPNTFEFKQLLPNINYTISAINRTRDGALWLGTYRNGVLRLYNGELQQVTTANGLPNNHVLDILEDQEGCLGIDPRWSHAVSAFIVHHDAIS